MAAARVVAWDARSSLVALNAVTAALFLPAWPVAVLAVAGRRWALAGAASVLAVAHVLFLLPELSARTPLPPLAVDIRPVRLFSANLYAGNPDISGLAAEIEASAPDVVFLQEATPDLLAALDRSEVLAEVPNRVTVIRSDPFAHVLASRWPLLDHDVMELDGLPIAIRATVDAGRGPIRLYSVHVVAPFGGARRAWTRGLDAITAAVRAEREPTLVAGDLNATWGHRAFHRLLDTGLTDAAAARGRPFQMTWPRDLRLVPPVARIDHVLTTDGLVVTAIRTGEGRGSDHRPIVADVVRTGMGSPGPG